MSRSRYGAGQAWARYPAVERYSLIGVPWPTGSTITVFKHGPQFSSDLQCEKGQDGIAHFAVLLCAAPRRRSSSRETSEAVSLADRKTAILTRIRMNKVAAVLRDVTGDRHGRVSAKLYSGAVVEFA